MTHRLKTAVLLMAILIIGIGLVVVATERVADADETGPRLLTSNDVVEALAEQGIVVDDERSPAHHPLLSIAGMTLTTDDASIQVFIYPTVAARVADEQIIQRYVIQMQALASGSDQSIRVTSARNVLLLFHAESAGLASSILEAARSLTVVAGR